MSTSWILENRKWQLAFRWLLAGASELGEEFLSLWTNHMKVNKPFHSSDSLAKIMHKKEQHLEQPVHTACLALDSAQLPRVLDALYLEEGPDSGIPFCFVFLAPFSCGKLCVTPDSFYHFSHF